MRTGKLISNAVVALCALVAALAFSCIPAGGEVTHKYLSSITEVPAEGPGKEPVARPGLLTEVRSLTADEGKLYVTEQIESVGERTDVFDTTTHAFVSQFDRPAPPVESAYEGIAVGHSTGNPQVYVGAVERIGGEPYSVVVPYDVEGHQLGRPWTGEDTPSGAFSGHDVPSGGELEGQLVDVAVDNDPTSLLGDWAAGDVLVDTSSRGYLRAHPALNAIDVFKPEAGGTEKYVTQLTGTCELPGACPGEVVPFNRPSRIAVDPRNGNLLVVDSDKEEINQVVDMFRPGPAVDEYEFAGSLTESPNGPFHGIEGIAVDGGEGSLAEGAFYVVENGAVYQFDSAGRYVGRFSTPSTRTFGAAVDPTIHDVYVGAGDSEEGQVQIFGPSLLLPDVTTQPASKLMPEGATLDGMVNPDDAKAGETTCRFAWGTSESFGHSDPCPVPVAEGESPVPVTAALQGLEPDTTYYYRLQASNANGTNEGEASQTQHFTTPGPGLAEASVRGISSTSATLTARIDPHGTSTTCYFQYGTTAAYGTDTPVAPGEPIGAGESEVEVTRHLQTLAPSTTYHYRVVVVSEIEVEPGVFGERAFDGHDQTFITQPNGGALELPDGRAWELVSPPDKQGASIDPLPPSATPEDKHETIQSSASGDSIVYTAFAPTDTTTPGYAAGVQVLSKRGVSSWSSQDLALPHRGASGPTEGSGDFRFFSDDLSLAVAEPAIFGEFTSLAPEATPPDTERTLYLRHNETCGAQPGSCYLPLVTSAPGYADVAPGTAFGLYEGYGQLKFVGATRDLNHVLFLSPVALNSEPISGISLYEWSAGKPPAEELQLIGGELPDRPDPFSSNGGRNAISENGSRVIFETSAGHLYQRDTARRQTVQLDEAQPGAPGSGASVAVFQAASSDGSLVYFTDVQKLTKDAGSREGEPDLYECRMFEISGKDKCDLTDLTPRTAAGRAHVERSVLGASEDGSYVYAVATGVLSNQPNSRGESPVVGAPNLYEMHNGAVEFVAGLSPSDQGDWNGASQLILEPGLQPTRVSPNGRYVAFMSDRPLTGYDNLDVSSGKPDEEVFMFDSATKRLICASCNPSGVRPEGDEPETGIDVAASVPGWTKFYRFSSFYQARYLSDSGRLFFNSSDALVPQDINRSEDVYEYEPAGVGNCSTAAPHYDADSNGCMGLISSGTARGESTFMEASENGDDVFFLTTERLAGNDVDGAADVYDARVCSAAEPCTSEPARTPPCTTADACRAAPLPQPGIFAPPASATFNGAGNIVTKQAPVITPKSLTRAQKLARALRICRRKTKRKRAVCERIARRRYSTERARGTRAGMGGRG